jgi:hypothetical protein
MSVRYGVAVVAAASVFGSLTVATAGSDIRSSAVAGVRPGGASNIGRGATAAPSPRDNAVGQFAALDRQAPIGHRQPRASDVPDNTESSPTDLELRRLDEEIDRKLTICRGC